MSSSSDDVAFNTTRFIHRFLMRSTYESLLHAFSISSERDSELDSTRRRRRIPFDQLSIGFTGAFMVSGEMMQSLVCHTTNIIKASLNLIVKMISCSDDVRHVTGIEGDCLGNSVNMNVPVKPIDSWSRGISRRLPMGSAVESLHRTLLLDMEISSRILKPLPPIEYDRNDEQMTIDRAIEERLLAVGVFLPAEMEDVDDSASKRRSANRSFADAMPRRLSGTYRLRSDEHDDTVWKAVEPNDRLKTNRSFAVEGSRTLSSRDKVTCSPVEAVFPTSMEPTRKIFLTEVGLYGFKNGILTFGRKLSTPSTLMRLSSESLQPLTRCSTDFCAAMSHAEVL
ncbi:unnamed protein product [Protopolystoma xenopodis]|uniref:Uncharacterized protein n=1 Tax=Protopolystoma xenopodis TaxID=117903 RepID=A0A448X0E0_9PLAT|nr:unnamed protein product [Protopolystoma xenopodis]